MFLNKLTHKSFELNDLDEIFQNCADDILNSYELKINEQHIEITEIEFYLNDNNNLLDCYAHNHRKKEDYKTGELRLHESGIDIAISSGKYYGGILLRGLRADLKHHPNLKNPFIDGPWNTAKHVLQQILLNGQSHQIELIKSSKPKKDIHQFPRVGLWHNPQNKNARDYIYKNWRFMKYPLETKNGKCLMALKLIKDDLEDDEIKKLVKIEYSTLQGYRKYISESALFTPLEKSKKLNVRETCMYYDKYR